MTKPAKKYVPLKKGDNHHLPEPNTPLEVFDLSNYKQSTDCLFLEFFRAMFYELNIAVAFEVPFTHTGKFLRAEQLRGFLGELDLSC